VSEKNDGDLRKQMLWAGTRQRFLWVTGKNNVEGDSAKLRALHACAIRQASTTAVKINLQASFPHMLRCAMRGE